MFMYCCEMWYLQVSTLSKFNQLNFPRNLFRQTMKTQSPLKRYKITVNIIVLKWMFPFSFTEMRMRHRKNKALKILWKQTKKKKSNFKINATQLQIFVIYKLIQNKHLTRNSAVNLDSVIFEMKIQTFYFCRFLFCFLDHNFSIGWV